MRTTQTWAPIKRAKGYYGLSKLRKTFQRLELTQQHAIGKELVEAGKELRTDGIMFARMAGLERTGDMIRALDYKVSSRLDRVVVGPGAAATQWQKTPWSNTSNAAKRLSMKQKDMKMQFFKGYWAEFGTGPPGPQEATPFMNRAWDNNKVGIRNRVNAAFSKALQDTVNG